MLPERTYGQRLQDDEDHRLAMCGLTFDARHDEELQDFQQRHYDFIFTPATFGATGERRRAVLPAVPVSAATIFAPGSSRARYPLGAKQGPRAWEETPARTGAVSLVPPPLQTEKS